MRRQVFAFSGVLGAEVDRRRNVELTMHAVGLARVPDRPVKVCYLPTAVGDSPEAVRAKTEQFSRERADVEFSVLTLFPQPNVVDPRAHLLAQDVILVEGGSVVNLMAVWRAHDLPATLRRCWEAGVVLAGASAGSLCWHQGGPTDSWGDALAPFTEGLAFLPFSNSVHDDLGDQPRRRVYRQLVASGVLGPGYATENGVGLHYVDDAVHEVVSVRAGAGAWFVERAGVGTRDTALPARLLPSRRDIRLPES